MKTEKIEKTITLTNSLSAKIILFRVGQEQPADGDGVVVNGKLQLPLQPQTCYLHNDICFGKRLEVGEELLTSTWGKLEEDAKNRQRNFNFTALTWKEAFQEALEFLETEIQKLLDALEARKQTLVDAEKEE